MDKQPQTTRQAPKKFIPFLLKENGSVLVLSAICFVILIGFCALAIDVGLWYHQKRKLQLTSDAAAIGGAFALAKIGSSSVVPAATHDAQLNGFTANASNKMTINNPPTSGPHTGNNQAVEVILKQPASLYLSKVLGISPPLITVRSVAIAGSAPYCIIALDQSSSTSGGIDVKIVGSTIINAPCNVYVNSPLLDAVRLDGSNAQLNVNLLNVVGGTLLTGGATINATQGILTKVSPIADPYSSFQVPTYAGCTQTNFTAKNAVTVNPGVYCNGFTINGGGSVTMNPGVYIIDGGNFTVNSKATLTGKGVTIILTSSTNSNYGSVSISSTSTVNLSAPTTGATSGFLFYGDRRSTGLTQSFGGDTGTTLSGILYFPSSDMTFLGGSTSSGDNCISIVTLGMKFSGNLNIGSGCPTQILPTRLVE